MICYPDIALLIFEPNKSTSNNCSFTMIKTMSGMPPTQPQMTSLKNWPSKRYAKISIMEVHIFKAVIMDHNF